VVGFGGRQAQPTPNRDCAYEEESVKTMKNAVLLALRLALIAGVLSPIYLTGCNTVRGAGEDVEELGEELQEEAIEEQND
jgi:predicted small secreted protein